jgi:hypothetical protein
MFLSTTTPAIATGAQNTTTTDAAVMFLPTTTNMSADQLANSQPNKAAAANSNI